MYTILKIISLTIKVFALPWSDSWDVHRPIQHGRLATDSLHSLQQVCHELELVLEHAFQQLGVSRKNLKVIKNDNFCINS
jgi:hypothetical protein